MGQSIDARGRGDMRWHARHQGRIQSGHQRYQFGVDELLFFMRFGVRDNGHDRDFGASAGRGGEGEYGKRALSNLHHPGKLAWIFRIGAAGRNDLGGIHRGASADRDYCAASVGPQECTSGIDLVESRVGFDAIVNHAGDARGFQFRCDLSDNPQFDQDLVGHDQDLLDTQSADRATQFQSGVFSGERDRDRNRQQLGEDSKESNRHMMNRALNSLHAVCLASGRVRSKRGGETSVKGLRVPRDY